MASDVLQRPPAAPGAPPAAPAPAAAPAPVATTGLTRSQKAAAVLLSVGSDAASKVLRHLNEAEVEQVALEVATLGDVGPETMKGVLEEFRTEAVAHAHLVSGGEHHARALLRQVHGSKGDEIIDRLLATVQTAPFYFLRLHDPVEVVQHLRDEHPQTLALILAHLPSKFAAQILAGLEPDVQADVARRVATLERTSPEVVTRVEAALEDRLGVYAHGSRDTRGGVKELAALLNQSDRGTERAILGELEATDPELAEEVRSLMFVFEDIVTLDDRSVQELLRQVDMRQLAHALKGVRADVKEVVERNLSQRARETLAEEIDVLGPVRVADVEQAQTEIVRHIRRLEEEGTIVINRGNDGEFVE
jgi:flagellar motor switch protein FliG